MTCRVRPGPRSPRRWRAPAPRRCLIPRILFPLPSRQGAATCSVPTSDVTFRIASSTARTPASSSAATAATAAAGSAVAAPSRRRGADSAAGRCAGGGTESPEPSADE